MSKKSTIIVGALGIAAVAALFTYDRHELSATQQEQAQQLKEASLRLTALKEWGIGNQLTDFSVRAEDAVSILSKMPDQSLNAAAAASLKATIVALNEAKDCGYNTRADCAIKAGRAGYERHMDYLWYGAGPALLSAYLNQARSLIVAADAAEQANKDRVAAYLYYAADIALLRASLSSTCDTSTPDSCVADQLSVEVNAHIKAIMQRLYGPPSSTIHYPLTGNELQSDILYRGGPRRNDLGPVKDNRIEGLTKADELEIVSTAVKVSRNAAAELADKALIESAAGRTSLSALLYKDAGDMMYRANLFDVLVNNPAAAQGSVEYFIADGDARATQYYGEGEINRGSGEGWYLDEMRLHLRAMEVISSLN